MPANTGLIQIELTCSPQQEILIACPSLMINDCLMIAAVMLICPCAVRDFPKIFPALCGSGGSLLTDSI
jgi:hypothetical protein